MREAAGLLYPDAGRGTPANGSVPPVSDSPVAQRLAMPRWRDTRLVLGLVLVLLSVLLGARVISAANRTQLVVTAARGLPVGHVLAESDLATAAVRLTGASAANYWPATDATGLVGHALLVAIAAGDLLPRSAVAAGAAAVPTRQVSVPVDPGRVPALVPGQLVDVFATYKGNGATPPVTLAVVRGAEFLGIGGSSAAGDVAVRLRVTPAQTGLLVEASEVAALDIVAEEPAGNDAGDVGPGPFVAPGGGS